MRLSDAIATGRVLIERLEAADARYCAVGMALGAIGRPVWSDGPGPYGEMKQVWPWLNGVFANPSSPGFTSDGLECVFTIFDRLVMHGIWTLDQLIDWVRQNEPSDAYEPISVPKVTEEQLVSNS